MSNKSALCVVAAFVTGAVGWLVPTTLEAQTAPDLQTWGVLLGASEGPWASELSITVGVLNAGDGASAATTLRYYRSSDATISTSDTQVGTKAVGALQPSGTTSVQSPAFAGPSDAGTYYYGGCVDAVTDESDTTNNCSASVEFVVLETNPPDLVVESPSVSDDRPVSGATFTLSATVRNAGDGPAAWTTVRYYRSSDATISTSDTQVGTDSVGGLSDSGHESTELTAIELTAETAGTYYYGVCVDAVTDESDTANNCSASVEVEVVASNNGNNDGKDDDDQGKDDQDDDDQGNNNQGKDNQGVDDQGNNNQGKDNQGVDAGADDEPSRCTLVAPYWSGPTGGFTVKPAPGQASVSVTCGQTTDEYVAENGVVTRLLRSACPGTGLQLTGAAPGGWFWQHGDRNAAVAPFVCSEALGGPPAVVPGGVTADVTDNGTWFKHDTERLVGIIPHLAGNECSEYVTPYWHGNGGIVVRPAEGRDSVKVRVQCGATYSTMTRSAGGDGVIAELVRKSYCTDAEGIPRQGQLTVTGAAPGGWFWINGERNAAVGPLMCADLLGGPAAVDPGGVTSQTTDDGTYFSHNTDRLIGVVPHVVSDRNDN